MRMSCFWLGWRVSSSPLFDDKDIVLCILLYFRVSRLVYILGEFTFIIDRDFNNCLMWNASTFAMARKTPNAMNNGESQGSDGIQFLVFFVTMLFYYTTINVAKSVVGKQCNQSNGFQCCSGQVLYSRKGLSCRFINLSFVFSSFLWKIF